MTDLDQLESVYGSRVFRIPDYQREYSWGETQRRDLLYDLEGLRQIDSHKQHFMGTLVLHDKNKQLDAPGKEYQVVDIVDGQQRLTTLAILLSCIADELDELEGDQADYPARSIRENFLAEKIGVDRIVKLHLQGRQSKYFDKYILRDEPHPKPETPGDANLRNAEKEFEQYLSDKRESADDWLGYLLELKQAITQRLAFVVYEVEDEAEVGIMFEVMNARGKPLTQLEKVKNYLLYLVSKVASGSAVGALSDRVNDTWKHVLSTIQGVERADEDQLLLYDWVINPDAPEGENPNRVGDVHRAVKRWANLRTMAPKEIKDRVADYVARLARSCDSYRDLVAPRSSGAFGGVPDRVDDLIDHVDSLHRIGRPATVLPLLMVIYQKFESEPDVCAELFRLLEVYSFRTAAMEFYANKGRSRVYRYARKVSSSNVVSGSDVKEWVERLINDHCPTSRFKTSLEAPDRNFYDWNQLLYFLYEYEWYIRKEAKQEVPVDWERLSSRDVQKQETIEHILPKGENTLDSNYWAEHFSKEEWREYKNRLGNLCITNWNSKYYNRSFPDKCGSESSEKGYRHSQWKQEQELARDWNDWSPDAIEERHERLVEFALQRWSV